MSKSRNSTLAMVETAFLASTTGIIFLINYYFPLGPFLRMLYPIPIALGYLRWGQRCAWMTMTVTVLLLTILMGPTRSIQFLIPHGLMAVMLGFLWKRRSPWVVTLTFGTLAGAAGVGFQFWLLSALLGENLWAYSTIQVTELIRWGFQLVGSLEQPELWLIQTMAIAGIVIANFAYMILVHVAAWLLCDRLGNPISPPPEWLQALVE
ncbi:putative membrane protein (DUF2232) [Synechococcus sp. PCC 7502]|uniref:DUF2232 domain-containing protein n=1 Tax=Synechococcus sp. PCC 7502 TaxID=1173263 RepID=UPI00029FA970|nr:DUF2232 domain-containing protein [Synechococcus sp. PCC 7502]AFY74522.1 putative membrane protein (DUF2232) [Synechococcus sp. PCC 7502]